LRARITHVKHRGFTCHLAVLHRALARMHHMSIGMNVMVYLIVGLLIGLLLPQLLMIWLG